MYFFHIQKAFPNFPGQKENEKLEFVIRKCFFALLPALFRLMFWIVVILIFLWMAFSPTINLGSSPISTAILGFVLIISIYAAITFGKALIDYYFDLVVVTDQRIIYVNQEGFFRRTIAGTNLGSIQDVHCIRNGILKSIFNFGEIEIRTASDENDIDMQYIKNPEMMAGKILELQHKTQSSSSETFDEEHLINSNPTSVIRH